MHISTIENTLEEIESIDIPSVYVFNKIDLISNDRLETLKKRYENSIFISALKDIGLVKIIDFISRLTSKDFISKTIKISYSNLSLIDEIYNLFNILNRKDLKDHVQLKAEGSPENFNKIFSKLENT